MLPWNIHKSFIKKLKFIKTYAHKTLPGVICSGEKCKHKDAVLNHNCIKLTVVHTIYFCNNFVATSCCYYGLLSVVSI